MEGLLNGFGGSGVVGWVVWVGRGERGFVIAGGGDLGLERSKDEGVIGCISVSGFQEAALTVVGGLLVLRVLRVWTRDLSVAGSSPPRDRD